MKRLLILACSARKNPAAGDLPAIDRYDGPAFLVLRKFLREAPQDAPVVLILSAKYGLIESTREIPDYDCRMSAGRAKELRPQVQDRAAQALRSETWRALGLCAGREYRSALDGIAALVPTGASMDVLGGGLGPRLTNLAAWLRQSVQARRDGALA